MLAFDEIIHHAASERSGTIEGAGGDHVLEAGWLQLDQHLLHAAGFQLEYAGGVAGGDQVVTGLVIVAQKSDVEIRIFARTHQLDGVFDHGQVLEPQEVEFDQTYQFDIFH